MSKLWAFVLALGAATATLAQGVSYSSAIDVQHFKPGTGAGDILNVQTSEVPGHLRPGVGLFLHFAENPLVLRNPSTGAATGYLVDSQLQFDLVAAIGLGERVELGLALPLALQGSNPGPALEAAVGKVGSFGLGDVRLSPKVYLASFGGTRVAAAAALLLPTGGSSNFKGQGGFGIQPRLIADHRFESGLKLATNLGLDIRRTERLLNLAVGPELTFGAGAELPFQVKQKQLAVSATAFGSLGLSGAGPEEIPVEVVGALGYRVMPGLWSRLGAGVGMTQGYGAPDFRVMGGIYFQPQEAKKPPVVVAVLEPTCKLGPEDLDGFEDQDACADPDNDRDGVGDEPDVCPNEPETKNGYLDRDGCQDAVPEAPVALAAAPQGDTDQDGLPDDQDRCPKVAEDADGFEDQDGCPEPDNDRDGVADAKDLCPLEAETINSVKDDDGCPDAGKSKVVIRGSKIVILDKVYFATGKDVVLAKSFGLLGQVALVLRANPQIKKVRVEGHTDDVGADGKNLDLSQRRARSVMQILLKANLEPSRLEAVGYGETTPVDSNKTAKGREANRRVEFTILEVEPVETILEVTP